MPKIMLRLWKCYNKKPDDFVIGTGKTFTIKDFINRAAKKIKLDIKWIEKVLKKSNQY